MANELVKKMRDALAINQELIAEADKEIETLKSVIKENAPKVEFYDIMADSSDLMPFSDFAKTACFRGQDGKIKGRNKIMDFLRIKKILTKRDGVNYPDQRFINNGCFEMKAKQLSNGKHKPVPMMTAKGIQFVIRILSENGFNHVEPEVKNPKTIEIEKLLFQ
jgi:phage antirepressor YoqD-like protein